MNPLADHPQPERYRLGIVRRFRLTADAHALLGSRGLCIVAPQDADRLASCSEFLPLSEHARHLSQQLTSEAQRPDPLSILHAALEAGALISHTELVTDASPADPEGVGARIEWIGMPTTSRWDRVVRAVRSYSSNMRAFGRSARFFVAAQPKPSDVPAKNALTSLATQLDLGIDYAGELEKIGFVREIAADNSIPPEVIRFAIMGLPNARERFGANRNTILLHTAGAQALSIDDDTACDVMCAPGSAQDVAFGSEADPCDAWFFGSRQAAIGFVEHRNADVLSAHEELLGKRPHRLFGWPEARGGIRYGEMCSHILTLLYRRTGRILSTYNGVVGDPGLVSDTPFLLHPNAKVKERFAASGSSEQAAQSFEVVRQAKAFMVCHGTGPAGISAFLGLDNRELLPPFFPMFRGEDGVFADILARCQESSCIGHIPISLLHERPGTREFGDSGAVRMCDFLASAVSSCTFPLGETSCADRLQRLGRHLMFLGELPDMDAVDWARAGMLARASAIARTAEAVLMRERGYPPHWAEAVSRVVERLGHSLTDPGYAVPEEVSGAGTTKDGIRAAMALIRGYGELLHWWPAIVERARRLADTGRRVGRPLR